MDSYLKILFCTFLIVFSGLGILFNVPKAIDYYKHDINYSNEQATALQTLKEATETELEDGKTYISLDGKLYQIIDENK